MYVCVFFLTILLCFFFERCVFYQDKILITEWSPDQNGGGKPKHSLILYISLIKALGVQPKYSFEFITLFGLGRQTIDVCNLRRSHYHNYVHNPRRALCRALLPIQRHAKSQFQPVCKQNQFSFHHRFTPTRLRYQSLTSRPRSSPEPRFPLFHRPLFRAQQVQVFTITICYIAELESTHQTIPNLSTAARRAVQETRSALFVCHNPTTTARPLEQETGSGRRILYNQYGHTYARAGRQRGFLPVVYTDRVQPEPHNTVPK